MMYSSTYLQQYSQIISTYCCIYIYMWSYAYISCINQHHINTTKPMTPSITSIKSKVLYGPYGRGGTVSGTIEPGWELVRAAYEANFAHDLELGSQLCIYHSDQLVVDLWGKSSKQIQYSPDTIQNIYSSGKNMEAVCMALLVDRGLVSYDDKVCKYWAEFGQHGKDTITIADVLRHDGGVPFFSDPSDMKDRKRDKRLSEQDVRDVEPMERVIEGSGKWHLLGQRHYHAITRGWILSGIIRRVDPGERTLGRFMREEICDPLGAKIYCGIPPAEQKNMEFADLTSVSREYALLHYFLPARLGLGDPTVVGFVKTFTDKQHPIRRHNVADWLRQDVAWHNTVVGRELEFPSGGMHANARSIALVNSALAGDGQVAGIRLLSSETVREMMSDPVVSSDAFMNASYSFSKGGVARMQDMKSCLVPNDFSSTFEGFWGWGGLGGSWSLWHPEKNISLAYTPNAKTIQPLGGPRGDRIMKAVQAVLKRL